MASKAAKPCNPKEVLLDELCEVLRKSFPSEIMTKGKHIKWKLEKCYYCIACVFGIFCNKLF